MATDETVTAHPGDILQDQDGLLYLATETHSWGVGAVQRAHYNGEVRETYSRLKPGQFVVVGTAHMLPEEVAQARRDSLATERALAREAGVPPVTRCPRCGITVFQSSDSTGPGCSSHPEAGK